MMPNFSGHQLDKISGGMVDFFTWLNESIQDQEQRIKDKIQSTYPEFTDVQIDYLIANLKKIEQDLSSEEDKRRNYSLWQFLGKLKVIPNESFRHTVDRLSLEFRRLVNKSNSKDPNSRLVNFINEIKKLLPKTDNDTIANLANKALKANLSISKVVSDYLSSQSTNEEFKPVVKMGDIEVFYISKFQAADKMDKHLDTGEKSPCHVMFQGTKWCVRFQNYFTQYHPENKPLILVRQNGKPFALGQAGEFFKDVNDEDLSDDEMADIATPLLMTKNIDVIELAAPFTNNFFSYLQSISPEMLTKLAKKWFGPSDAKFIDNNLVLQAIDNDTLKEDYLGNRLPDFDERIEELTSEYLADDKFINDLNYNNDNLINDYLEKSVDKKPDGWDDMEVHEAIQYDQDLYEQIRMIASDNISSNSYKSFINSLCNALSEGMINVIYKNGIFYFCLEESETQTILQMTVREVKDDYDSPTFLQNHINDAIYNIKEIEIHVEFDTKQFNVDVRKLIDSLQKSSE